MLVLKRLAPAAAVLVVSALTGCADSTSPDDVNPGLLESSFATATATFNNNAAFQSLAVLSNLFPVYAGSAMLQASIPAPPASGGPAALAQLRARGQALRTLASRHANPQALFPANVLGKTLVWDTTLHDYVISNLTGAPSNGIRILIYAVNPITAEPTVPVQQLGYVDLTDESTPAADRLGVLLTLGSSTIADYTVSLSSGTVRTEIRAVGYINNAQGAERVDFDFLTALDFAAQAVSSVSQLNAAGGTSIFVDVEETLTAVTVEVRVQREGNSIQINVTVSDSLGTITGTVKYNGTTVATISGTVDAPVFTGAGGRTLTSAEVAALFGIFEKAVNVATELSDAVHRPAGIVFN